MNTMASAVGYAAAILTTISFVPQVLKVWRTRSARDVSLGMYSLFTLGIFTWLVYGVLIESWPVILANFVTLVLAGMVLAMKLKFGRRRSCNIKKRVSVFCNYSQFLHRMPIQSGAMIYIRHSS